MSRPRCLYPSKPCPNVRSIKPDGTRHRLCTMHREKAKEAQRRWLARQRTRAGCGPTRLTLNETTTPSPSKRQRVDAQENATTPLSSIATLDLDTSVGTIKVETIDDAIATPDDVMEFHVWIQELCTWASSETD